MFEGYKRDINSNAPFAFTYFHDALITLLKGMNLEEYSDIVILCIGTDRATGDSLGPLIGSKLKDIKYPNVHVYGTLDEPVCAKNLGEYRERISRFPKPFIIAIDACLGRIERIGYINVKQGPIAPGSGVNKNLGTIGDVSITGIVNVGGFMEIMILQNTRLSIVMNLASLIANGIKFVMWSLNRSVDYVPTEESRAEIAISNSTNREYPETGSFFGIH